MSRADLNELFEGNDKRRFSISSDGTFIRAAQGQPVPVYLGLEPTTPPEFLYHGTARHRLDSIFSGGLHPMQRQQVHLSNLPVDAEAIGRRHGKPVVLEVAALAMNEM
jgi:putative RNA 2'-phosphotransferase